MPKPSPRSAEFNDYDAIASAVAESARGRWFLAEHARRCRQADTSEVLAAIAALHAALLRQPGDVSPEGEQSNAPPVAAEAATTPAPPRSQKPATAGSRLTPTDSFAEIDASSLQERLRLFR